MTLGALPLLSVETVLSAETVLSGEAAGPAAFYRAAVTQDDLDSWIAFRDNAPFLRGQHAIDGLVLVETVGAEALRNGIDQRPVVRLELAQAAGRTAWLRLRQESNRQITVSDAAIEAFLATGPYPGIPRRVRVRNLFRRLPEEPADRQAVWDAMESHRQAVLDGADFGALAAEHSESETRWRRGLLGNVRPGTFRPEVDRVVQGLAKGEVSEILETGDGLSLFFCEDILPPRVVSDAERWDAARTRLRRRQFDARWESLLGALDARAALEWVRSADGGIEGVRFTGGYLSLEELEVLLGAEALEHLRTQDDPAIPPNLKTFIQGQMARLHQAEQNWRDDATTRAEHRWHRLQILTNHQVAEWVGQRFEEPPEAEVRAHFEAHRETFEVPEVFHISLIQLPKAKDDPRQDYAKAATLLASIRGGEATFEAVAKAHSVHPSADSGGHLGSLNRTRLSPRLGLDLTRALLTLDEAEVSELVTAEGALWILRLDRREAKRLATYAEARDSSFQAVVQGRLDAIQAEVVEAWLAGLDITTEPAGD